MHDLHAAGEVIVASDSAGQRIDNFLIRRLKGVPKTRLYRALRGGEVRVNGGRKKASYHLQDGDRVRIPPLRLAAAQSPNVPAGMAEKIPVLFEDENFLAVDKPAGLASHGGSGLQYGLIEALRALHPQFEFLELVHRLDRDTSGCLLLAKSRAALTAVQAELRARRVEKVYLALVMGELDGVREVRLPLSRPGGGKAMPAASVFTPKRVGEGCTLAEVRLLTGRMHQARLHAAAEGMPIAGDRRYGDREFNRRMREEGLRRLFLHASCLRFGFGGRVEVRAELPRELEGVLGWEN